MHNNRKDYLSIIDKRQDIPIFFQPWWLDIVCGSNGWDVLFDSAGNGKIQAIWPIPVESRYGGKLSRIPTLTPFLGPIFLTSDLEENRGSPSKSQRKLLKILLDQHDARDFLYSNQYLSFDFTNWQPFYWKGYQQETYYRYILDLNNNMVDIKGNLSRNIKSRITSFEKLGYIKAVQDSVSLYHFIEESFRNTKTPMPFLKSTFTQLTAEMLARTESTILMATNKNKAEIGGALVLIDHARAYFLIQGVASDYRKTGVPSALLWSAIKYAKQKGCTEFDFAGSVVQSIATFMSGFGGSLRPYHRIYKYKNKVVQAAHNLLKR